MNMAKEKTHKLEELTENHRMERLKADEKKRAEAWKASYDALVDAGFTPDQAWEMTMKRFECD